MKIPRHADKWLPGYIQNRFRCLTSTSAEPRRLWLAVTDHYEPFWRNKAENLARDRVALWNRYWPEISSRNPDSQGQPAQYSFFYPEEEYRPDILDTLALWVQSGWGDVEIHLHHDGEGRQNFIDRMSTFRDRLHSRHGLLRKAEGRVVFAFIHGNYALDNSQPNGKHCGINDELRVLAELGCYADFTMPSGASPTQARMVNQIYWAQEDPNLPKSYNTGIPLQPGGGREGDLLLIPGPFGLRWAERLVPRIECAEIAGYDLATPYRVGRWLQLAPRIGGDVFLKLHTHGTQERNSSALLEREGLETLYRLVREECRRRNMTYHFVSAWQMYLAVEALRLRQDPVTLAYGNRTGSPVS